MLLNCLIYHLLIPITTDSKMFFSGSLWYDYFGNQPLVLEYFYNLLCKERCGGFGAPEIIWVISKWFNDEFSFKKSMHSQTCVWRCAKELENPLRHVSKSLLVRLEVLVNSQVHVPECLWVPWLYTFSTSTFTNRIRLIHQHGYLTHQMLVWCQQ